MRRFRLVPVLLAVRLLTGCAFDAAPVVTDAGRPQIRCGSDAECPTGWLCPKSLGRCVPLGDRDDVAPALDGTPALTPGIGTVGQTFTLDFRVSEALGQDPAVRLETGGGRLVAWPLDEARSDRAALHYVFHYVATTNEAEGARGVTIDLVDAAGNAVSNLAAGSLLLDFTRPRVVATTLAPRLAAAGAEVLVELQLSEPLPLPPQLELVHADGTREPLTWDGPSGTLGVGHRFRYRTTGQEPEGEANLRPSGSDEAGNLLVEPSIEVLRLDFTAPRVRQVLVDPPVARAGQRVLVEVDLDEDLAAGGSLAALDAVTSSFSHGYPEVSRSSSRLRFEHTVALGSDGRYRLELRDLTDLAGNRAAALTLGEVRYDTTAPGVSNVATDAPRYSAQAGHNVVTLTFDVSDPLVALQLLVLLGNEPFTCGPLQATSPSFTCTVTLDGTEPEGVAVVSIRAIDAAGNEGVGSALVRLDFTPPALVAGTAELALQPPPGCPASQVTRWAAGATARVSFVVEEPLAALPLVATSAPDVIAFTHRTGTTTSFSYEQTLGSAPVTQGAYTLEAEVIDEVGNAATLTLATTPALVVDTDAPVLWVNQAAVRYVRSPWGSNAPENLGGVTVPAGAYFALAPAEPLSAQGTLPSSTFTTAEGAPALLRVWADGLRSSLMGSTEPNADGTWPRLRLANLDTPAAWVSGLDDACNESPTVRLDQAEWVATPRPPTFGAPVHTAWTTPRVAPTLLQAFPVTQPVVGDGLAGPDQDAQLAPGAQGWEMLSAPTPASPGNPTTSGLASPTAAFDSARGRTVFFLAGATRETWEWDGLRWMKMTPLGDMPPAQSGHSLVYDSARGRVVMFSGSTTVNETWEWDGSTWRNVTPSTGSPPARRNPGIAYDSARQRVVLFGGSGTGGVYLSDTWEFDGRTWTRRPVAGPSARHNTSMAYDSVRGRVVLFGGRSSVYLSDTWEWDGTRWWSINPTSGSPTGRLGLSLDFDTIRNRVLLFGGSGSTGSLDELWDWDGAQWRSLTPTSGSPSARAQHAHAFDSHRGRLVVLGGSGVGPAPTDTREWDGQRWHDVTPSPAATPAFASHALAWDSGRSRVVLFGGMVSFAHQQQTWEYSGAQWRLVTPLTTPPGARIDHAMAYDPVRQRVVLFGGASYGGTLADTWEWDGQRWANVTPTSGNPGARYRHSMAWDPVRQRVLLFGGYPSYQDTWAWDGVAWTNVTPAGSPGARTSFALATDLQRNRVVLFGGRTTTGAAEERDTWEWDGAAWANVTPAAGNPPARSRHAMAWDPSAGRVVLFGGGNSSGSSYRNDTWEWDGTSWTQTSPQPSGQLPPGRYDFAMAWEGERVLVLGGHDQLFRGETWRYESTPKRQPAVGFSAITTASGLTTGQIDGLRVRAHCGGTVGSTAGAQLLGWFTGGVPRPPGSWSVLATNVADSAITPPYLAAAPAAFLEWTAGSPEEARGLHFPGSSTLNVQCRPLAAPGPQPGRVAMDYAEVRVRYRTQ